MTAAPSHLSSERSALRQLAEELREYTAMKYAGDCKCGKCQLVPRALVERIYHTLNGAAIQRREAPEGYVIMPREATRVMTMAGCDSLPSCEHVFGHAGEMLKNAYAKMVDVCGHPPQSVDVAQRQPEPEAYRETVRRVAAAREKGYAAARANLQEAWAALAMIRETIETLAPSGSVKAAEHLDGPTFMHEAEALVAGILAISSTDRTTGPLVPWELDCQRAVCAAPECECPAASTDGATR